MNNSKNEYKSCSDAVPLCVDLDHSLIKTDVLYELFVVSLKLGFTRFFRLLLELKSGKASYKSALAEKVKLDVKTLPVNKSVIELVELESKSRPVVLVTATHELIANRVAKLYPYFTDVLATNSEINLKGESKAKKLVELYGDKNFDYVGDSRADLSVWKHSKNGYYVGNDLGLLEEAKKLTNIKDHIVPDISQFGALIKAIRVHQWIKNVLVFIPLIAAHMIFDLNLGLKSIIAFLSFGLVASSVYLINDLLDLKSDRAHRSKSKRPLASGDLYIRNALLVAPLLLLLGLTFSFLLSFQFFSVIITYFLLTNLYSFFLKKKELIDILLLACLYTIRIIAGAAATSIMVSSWLFSFSVFIFFSLACAKRFVEIDSREGESEKIPGRGYFTSDREIIGAFGVASGITSVLVLALYVNAPEVTRLYENPKYLLLLCPLALYWICKIWLATFRGELDDDPIVYTLKEKLTFILCAFACGVLLIAH